LYLALVPIDTTLLRWANRMQPATPHRSLDRVKALARKLHVTRGRKLRLDATVLEADIDHPSHSTLFAGSVREFSRVVGWAQAVVDQVAAAVVGCLTNAE